MNTWWVGLTLLQQIIASLAITSTVILVIQVILLLFGLGEHDSGFDDGFSDHSGFDHLDDVDTSADISDLHTPISHTFSGMKLISFRGLVAFFAVGGWTGVILLLSPLGDTGLGIAIALCIAAVVGFAAMFLVAFFLKSIMNLQYSGNIEIDNAIGRTGSIYIRVPAKRATTGKVNILLQGRYSELDAMTDSETDLQPGQSVTVKEVLDSSILIVE